MALALAISASHGLVLFSPVPIAAAAILDAAWGRVALFGLPLALLLAIVGALWARWLSVAAAAPQTATPELHAMSARRNNEAAGPPQFCWSRLSSRCCC